MKEEVILKGNKITMYNSPNFIENHYLLQRIIIVLICVIGIKKPPQ